MSALLFGQALISYFSLSNTKGPVFFHVANNCSRFNTLNSDVVGWIYRETLLTNQSVFSGCCE